MLSGVEAQCSRGWQPHAQPPPGANAQVSCGLRSYACCKPTHKICLSPEPACRTLSPKHLAAQALKLGTQSKMVPVSYISCMQNSSTQQSTAQYRTAQGFCNRLEHFQDPQAGKQVRPLCADCHNIVLCAVLPHCKRAWHRTGNSHHAV